MTIISMNKTKERKPPSEEDRAAAERLFLIWEDYKTLNKINQTDAAYQLGITQGAFGQYIRGELSIGLEAALKFANYFNIPISAIKTFDSFDKYFAIELERRKFAQLPDEETEAVVRMLSAVKKEDKARLRWKIETWIEMIPGDVIQ